MRQAAEEVPEINIQSLRKFYHGFYIEEPVGNNAFSFAGRRERRIHVAPLVEGSLDDVRKGDETVFSDLVDGREVCAYGLKNFVYWRRDRQHVFIFDNHNHAFFFWGAARQAGVLSDGMSLVHVDQHKDTRESEGMADMCQGAEGWPDVGLSAGEDPLSRVYHAANQVLNVGNFIPPAEKLGWFGKVIQMGSAEAFQTDVADPFVLDIDLDIFAPIMDYIPLETKLARLRSWLGRTQLVTVATSPFFMDQDDALMLLRRIFAVETPGNLC